MWNSSTDCESAKATECLSLEQLVALTRLREVGDSKETALKTDRQYGETHILQCPSCAEKFDDLLEKTTEWGQHLDVIRQVKTESDLNEKSVAESLFRIQSALGNVHANSVSFPVLDGFDVIEELGRGASSVVYRAKQTMPSREVAIKILSAAFRNDTKAMSRFWAEANTLAQLDHANIVPILEVGEQNGTVYYTMPCILTGSLADRLDGTPWEPRKAAELIRDLARAIHEAHCAGIIHRDLKPANILIRASNLVSRVDSNQKFESIAQIADFGIAKSFEDSSNLTNTGDVIGTPSYMAPEQIRGPKDRIGPPADIYALGINLYELLTGRPPFKAESSTQTLLEAVHEEPLRPSRLQKRIPRDLETICLTAIEKQPSARYEAAAAMADDLDRFLAYQPIGARRIGRTERAIKWFYRRPAVACLTGVSVLAVVMLLSMWAVFTFQIKKERDTVRQTARQLGLERELAIENFDRAFKAIHQYMMAVKTNPQLSDDDSIELRKELLKHGTDFYEELLDRNQSLSELPAARLTTEKVRLEQARLFFAVGKMNYITEDFDEAIRSFGTAENICRRILGPKLVPSHSEDSGLLGAILLSLSKTHLQQNHPDLALANARDALKYFQSLVGLKLMSVDYENWYLAEAWGGLGIAQSNLDPTSAHDSLEQALEFCHQLPSVPDFRLPLARCQLSLGRLAIQANDSAAAFHYLSAACSEMDNIDELSPSQIRYFATRASCFSEMGDWCFRNAKPTDAIHHKEIAINVQQDLFEHRSYDRIGKRLDEFKQQLAHFKAHSTQH